MWPRQPQRTACLQAGRAVRFRPPGAVLLLGARVGWSTQDNLPYWHSSVNRQRSAWYHAAQTPAQDSAGLDDLPNMNRAGVEAKVEVRAMPPAMVLVTLPPSRKAPRNSKMPARVMADHSLRVLEPTEVPEGGAARAAWSAAAAADGMLLAEGGCSCKVAMAQSLAHSAAGVQLQRPLRTFRTFVVHACKASGHEVGYPVMATWHSQASLAGAV